MSAGEHPFVDLAREAIRCYLATGEFLDPSSEQGDPPPSHLWLLFADLIQIHQH